MQHEPVQHILQDVDGHDDARPPAAVQREDGEVGREKIGGFRCICCCTCTTTTGESERAEVERGEEEMKEKKKKKTKWEIQNGKMIVGRNHLKFKFK